MNNKELAHLFSEMADLMELRGDNAFKIRAYQKAARAIDNLPESLETLHQQGKLLTIDGIGKGIAEKITEAFTSGQIKEHEELLHSLPEGLLKMLEVSGMGPKKVKLVYDRLNITTLEELKTAAEAGRLQELPGMGKKTEEKILKGIQLLQDSSKRYLLGVARPIAEEILLRVKAVPGVQRAQITGSLRRGRETAGDVDILASTIDAPAVMKEFLATADIREVLAQGESKSSLVLKNGLQIDLRVVPDESFGAALQYFTGSKEHNVQLRELAVKKKLKVNEYGVFDIQTEKAIAGKDEDDVYQVMGLAWIPPELREGLGEIEDARNGQLPELIEKQHIRSALHNHTTASDGHMSLEELVEQSRKRDYEFIAVTDHSVSLGVANGLSPDRLKKRIEEIRKWNEIHPEMPVLAGSEVDIRVDGTMDYRDDLLAELDVVIAAVHMSFEQPREKITKRICDALENPHVDILAHPSGRLIGRRPAMDIDWEPVFSKAVETGVVLEINAHYMRLDLNDQRIRQAKQYGVRFSLDTDTHAVEDFDNLPFGIQTARRGRLTANDVINCLSYPEWKKFWEKKRK